MALECSQLKIAVIGLGYVGLPLALALSEKFDVVGFDISKKRISQLNESQDLTGEVASEELETTRCQFTSAIEDIAGSNMYIVGVPTPITPEFRPDLEPLIAASQLIGGVISCGDIVVYESTVYPGTTEDVCVPILEKSSGFKLNKDFYVGYSPERINPGDKVNTVKTIPKVISGSNEHSTEIIQFVYNQIVEAETFVAKTIRTAEMAKIIENTQRDMNIAVMNEFSRICSKLQINLYDVLEAAKTKWNFLPFYPGLVGGHCIGVDPYYLIEKSTVSGYFPELLSAGRKLNEAMADFIFDRILFKANTKFISLNKSKVLLLGYTFKADCPDTRNTKVEYLVDHFSKWGAGVKIWDPWVNKDDKRKIEIEKNVVFCDELEASDIIVHCVPHTVFQKLLPQKIVSGLDAKLFFDLHNSFEGAETIYS